MHSMSLCDVRAVKTPRLAANEIGAGAKDCLNTRLGLSEHLVFVANSERSPNVSQRIQERHAADAGGKGYSATDVEHDDDHYSMDDPGVMSSYMLVSTLVCGSPPLLAGLRHSVVSHFC